MIRTERDKTQILMNLGLLCVWFFLCIWAIVNLCRNRAEVFYIVLLIVGFVSFILQSGFVIESFSVLELTESGITKYGPFLFTRRYEWKEYPYCYVIWFSNRQSGKSYSQILFSKTEIDHKQAKKIRYDDSWKNAFTLRLDNTISLTHSQQLLDRIRALRPDLQIEYRNTYLAKGQYKS